MDGKKTGTGGGAALPGTRTAPLKPKAGLSGHRPVSVDGVGLTYDALGRVVEQNRSGSYTQVVYAPTGDKLALMNGVSTLVKAFVPLPGGATAVYNASGLAYYRHPDWLGSSRLASTPNRAVYAYGTYAPFGENYAESPATDRSFTGQNQDTVSGIYDFMFREYSPVQGRWISPDPSGMAAVDPVNPQSWNRYAYVMNDPLDLIDALGLDPCFHGKPGCPEAPPGSGDIGGAYYWFFFSGGQGLDMVIDQGAGVNGSGGNPANNGTTSKKPLCVVVFGKETLKSFGNLLPGKSDFAEMVNTVTTMASSIENIDPAQWLTQQITNWQTSALVIPASKALRSGLTRSQWLSQATKQVASKTGWQAFLFTLDYAMADALGKEISSFTSGECRAIGYDD